MRCARERGVERFDDVTKMVGTRRDAKENKIGIMNSYITKITSW